MNILETTKPSDAGEGKKSDVHPGVRISLPPDPPRTPRLPPAPSTRVTLAGMDIPFWDLVFLLVKIAIASIPAALILGVLIALISALISGFLGVAVSILK